MLLCALEGCAAGRELGGIWLWRWCVQRRRQGEAGLGMLQKQLGGRQRQRANTGGAAAAARWRTLRVSNATCRFSSDTMGMCGAAGGDKEQGQAAALRSVLCIAFR